MLRCGIALTGRIQGWRMGHPSFFSNAGVVRMGIDFFVKDGRGNVLASLPDTGALAELSGLMYRQTGDCCLRFIDPAGDACFNQLQRPVLLEEFLRLLPSIVNARAKDHISRIVDLLTDATDAHVYFWFVGD